ncbi:MAG: fasciclin domain-containing protein, partial [Brevundimonas sp.]|nr:fasciclin domain-containing protein [Brevundimonas sp.]
MTFTANRTLLVAGVAACAVFAGACSPAGEAAPASDAAPAAAQDGGATMEASRTIVEDASNSPDHTTLVAAVTAAG